MNTINFVDRIEASKILKVSTRTLDRYIRKHKFKVRKNGRKVMIKKVDIDKIIKDHIGRMVDLNEESFNDLVNGNGNKESVSLTVKDIKVKKSKENEDLNAEERIYKDLYTEAKNDLRTKQERLEAATYRVGQLEAQVKNMVPLLDYDKKEQELKELNDVMTKKAQRTEEKMKSIEAQLRSEKVAKWVYLSLTGLLLVAEPILFVLWAFS